MMSLPPRLKCRLFDGRALKKILSICVLGIFLFALHVNINIIIPPNNDHSINLFRPGISLNKEIRILRVGFVVYAVLAIHANIAYFVTAGFLYIDTERQTAVYAGAGHPPLLVCRPPEKEIHEISQKSVILSQMEDTAYKNTELKLHQGDRLVLYTDGIVEALNPAGTIYGAERFKEFIRAHSALAADPFCDSLLDTIAKWSKKGLNGSLDDDLTLLIVDVETATT